MENLKENLRDMEERKKMSNRNFQRREWRVKGKQYFKR